MPLTQRRYVPGPTTLPRDLVEQFARGNGTVFVGAGVSTGAGLPNWNGLVQPLRDDIEDCPEDANYFDIAQYFQNANSRNALITRIRQELSGTEPSEIHQRLIELHAPRV